MNLTKTLKILMIETDTTLTMLSKKLGTTRQNLSKKILNGDSMKVRDLQEILDILGYELKVVKKQE